MKYTTWLFTIAIAGIIFFLFKANTNENSRYDDITVEALCSLLDEKTKGLTKANYVDDVTLITEMIKNRGIGYLKSKDATTYDTFKFVVKAEEILRNEIISPKRPSELSSDGKNGREYVAFKTLLTTVKSNALMPPRNPGAALSGGLSLEESIKNHFPTMLWGLWYGQDKGIAAIKDFYITYEVE